MRTMIIFSLKIHTWDKVIEDCVFEIALLYSYGIKLWQKFQKL